MSAAIDETLTIRPQRVRIIGITSGCVTLKKPSTETSMTRCHCSAPHGRKDGVVMQAGVVDDDLDRAAFEQLLAGRARGGVIGDVERHRLGAAAGADDALDDRLGGVDARVGVGDDVQAVAAEALGDRLADGRRSRR